MTTLFFCIAIFNITGISLDRRYVKNELILGCLNKIKPDIVDMTDMNLNWEIFPFNDNIWEGTMWWFSQIKIVTSYN